VGGAGAVNCARAQLQPHDVRKGETPTGGSHPQVTLKGAQRRGADWRKSPTSSDTEMRVRARASDWPVGPICRRNAEVGLHRSGLGASGPVL
jgi:hypothetical protein